MEKRVVASRNRRKKSRALRSLSAGVASLALVLMGSANALAFTDSSHSEADGKVDASVEVGNGTDQITSFEDQLSDEDLNLDVTSDEEVDVQDDQVSDDVEEAELEAVQSGDVEEAPVAATADEDERATATTTDIVVHKRTFNPNLTGTTTPHRGDDYRNTEGAEFALYADNNGTKGAKIDADWAKCTVEAQGKCTIEVPRTNRGGDNYNKRFWVVEETPAPGTFANPLIKVGSAYGPTGSRHLVGRTTQMRPNTTIQMPLTQDTGTSPYVGVNAAQGASYGATPNSLNNPEPQPQCNVPSRPAIAIVLDESGSISQTEWNKFRAALTDDDGVLADLQDTNASVAILGFGTGITWHTNSNGATVPVHGNLEDLKKDIPTTKPGGTGAYTNWSAALKALNNGQDYDVVLFITDGAPNKVFGTNNPSVDGSNVTLRSVEAAIYAANTLKDNGSRMLAVGVGNGITDAKENLISISGQVENHDFFGVDDWDDLKKELVQINNELTCRVPVTVTKYQVDAQGQETLANGWTFGSSMSTATQAPTGLTDGKLVTGEKGAEHQATGQVDWLYSFTDPDATGTLEIFEDPSTKDGYTFDSGSCDITSKGVVRDTVTWKDANGPETDITVKVNERVDCVVKNRLDEATIVIQKTTDPEADGALVQFPFKSDLPTNGEFDGGALVGTTGDFNLKGGGPTSGGTYTVKVPASTTTFPLTVTEKTDDLTGWRLSTVTCSNMDEVERVDGGVKINEVAPGETLRCTFNNTNAEPTWTTWKASSPAGNNTAVPKDPIAETAPDQTITYYLYAQNKGNRTIENATLVDDLKVSDENGVLQNAKPVGFGNGPVTTVGSAGNTSTQVTLTEQQGAQGGATTVPDAEALIPLGDRGTVTFDEVTGKLTWVIPELEEGEFLRLSFPVKVNSGAYSKQLHNQLTASSPEVAPLDCAAGDNDDLSCNTWHETGTPRWSVTKSSVPASGATVVPGQEITYRLLARNYGMIPIEDIVLTDDLSGALKDGTFVEGSLKWGIYSPPTVVKPAPTAPNADDKIKAEIETLGGLQQVTLEYKVRVNDHAYGKTFENKVFGESTTTPPDECPENWDEPGSGYTGEACETEHKTAGPPHLTLVKEVRNNWDGTATANDWTLTATPSDDGAPALDGDGEVEGDVWPSYPYTLAEDGPNGYEVAEDWSCEGTGEFHYDDDTQEVVLGDDADVTCTIVNRDVAGAASVEKTLKSASMDADGVWTVLYDVAVSNTSTRTTQYTLTDTLRFGSGIDIESASWTGPAGLNGAWDLDEGMTTTLVTDRELLGDTTEVYRVTVKATISPESWAGAGDLECAANEGDVEGGFLNEATVTWPGGEDEDEACGEPSRPTVEKTFDSATQWDTDPLEWSVSYTITVTGGDDDSYYNLADVPGFPSGVTLVSGTATMGDESWPIPANGGTFREEVPIAAGAVHEYIVVWEVRIAEPIPGVQETCTPGEPGHGFFNEASMTVAGDEIDVEACGPIKEMVVPDVEKTVDSTTQNADGTWTITYDVVVSMPEHNPEGLSAIYSLTDTLHFGGDIKVNEASWTGPDNLAGDFKDGKATMATDRPLKAGASETYTVTVNATVDTKAFVSGSYECEREITEEGGGFLNSVELTSGDVKQEDHDCSEPVAPGLDKTGQVATQNADGSWDVSYTLTVTNPSADTSVVFTLTDTPEDLPAGVELAAGANWTAEAVTDGAPAVVDATRPDSGEWVIAKGTLAPGASFDYLVKTKVVVNLGEDEATIAECKDVDAEGIVLPNGSKVVSGGFETEDEGCTVVQPSPALDIDKAFRSASMDADGVWTVIYDVLVSNDSDAPTKYTLTDTLRFGGSIEVKSATWTGPEDLEGEWTSPAADKTTTFVTDRPLAAGESEAYVVTVKATVSEGGWKSGDLECKTPGSEGNAGFLNEATVTYPGGEESDEDCETPSLPKIEKVFDSATQWDHAPTEWSVAYTITVTGDEHFATVYDLADVPSFAQGVEIVEGTVTSVDDAVAGGPWIIQPDTGNFVTGVELPAGAVHEYHVVWDVLIKDGVPADYEECIPGTPGHGFFNEAKMTVAGEEIDDEACGKTVEFIVPDVEKTVTSTVQNDDGTWTITYDVVASMPKYNPENLDASYSLTDTLHFGGDIVINEASWIGPGDDAIHYFDGDKATMATDRPLKAGKSETFKVTVNATVKTEAFISGSYECESEITEAGSGFLNSAEIASEGVTHEVWDCSEPAAPGLDKTGQTATQNADGFWDVSYVLTVDNPSKDKDVQFTLTDTPEDLPKGVELAKDAKWTAEAVGTAPAVKQSVRPESGDWTIAEGTLAAGAKAQYLVKATVVVSADTKFEFEECENTSSTGIVLPNGSKVVSGGFETEDEGCTVVQPGTQWTLQKHSDPKSGSTVKPGQTVTYTLTAKNTGQVPVKGAKAIDDMSDVLDKATLVMPLDEQLTQDGTSLIWTMPDIPVGDSVTVSYKVVIKDIEGSFKIKNVVAPATPGGECLPGECTTTHPGGKLPVTGAQILGIALAAAALLGAGGGIYMVSRRRRGEHAA